MDFITSKREFVPPMGLPRGRLRSYHFGLPTYRFRLIKKHSWSEWLLAACLVFYAILCLVVYFQYVAPWIAGESETRIGADSDRFWEYAKLRESSSNVPLVSLTGNFFGPVTMVRIFHTGFAIMCFNFLLFLIALKVASSIPKVNSAALGFLFLANAELIPALTTLNKEIFALLAAALTLKYFYSKHHSKLLLLLSLFVSILARWEQAAILLLYFVLSHGFFRKRPLLALLSIVGLITVCYPFAFQLLGLSPDALDWIIQGDTTQTVDKIQRSFGFPLVAIPKIFLMMTGELHSPRFYTSDFWREYFHIDPQNVLFLPLSCLTTSLVFLYALVTKRLILRRPVVLLIAITLIVTAATPFTQSRYIYGVYTMLCIELARTREN